jgi:predicted RecB family nuclease
VHLLSDGTRRYSPKDLIAYLEGDFAAWCERLAAQGARLPAELLSEVGELRLDEDPQLDSAARKGAEHEARYLAALKGSTPGLVEIARNDPAGAEKTLAAMRAAAPVIYQAHLQVADWQGYPDFLFLVAGPSSLGDHHYVPWDTKLARSAKPYFIVQLCAYAELLEVIQGLRPADLVFVLGNDEVRRFPTNDYFFFYRQLKRSFLAFQDGWRADAMPDPGLDRNHGQWSDAAEAVLVARDHLGQVAGITRSQIHRFEEAGVTTFHGLAQSNGAPVRGINAQVLERLQLQARLQIDSITTDRPAWQHRAPAPDEPRRGLTRLPPPSGCDVFFDMEGFPFADPQLEYLFGAVTSAPAGNGFHEWWAHDRAEEKRAFEAFIDWVHARWRADPAMHIYHYASYEKSAVQRLMGQHATREREVDDLLRGEVFVDLYAIVKQGFIVGTPSYSLKDIERLYRPPRAGDVTSATGSVVQYQAWMDANEPRDWRESPILGGIRAYNRDDCESTRELRDWLLARQQESGIVYAPHVKEAGKEKKTDAGPTPAELLEGRFAARIESGAEPDPERARVTLLLGWLTGYHRREEKPMWWRMFERGKMTEEELKNDPACLGGLTRTDRPARAVKKSSALEYRFDPDQETKLHADDGCIVASDLELKTEILTMDAAAGLLELKVGPGKTLPDRLSLIPDEFLSAEGIKAALLRCAEAWEAGRVISRAVDDLLFRRAPRVRNHRGGQLIAAEKEAVPQLIDLVPRLDGTTLAIQGPPGTGKTFAAAAVIDALLEEGRRIGVAANNHKVILNLLGSVAKRRSALGHSPAALYKAGDGADDPLVDSGVVKLIDSKAVSGVLGAGPVVVGGTAWVWSRPELQGCLDYLFIDESGQVPLANAVAMGLSARNLILIGDQMQLGQPTQGAHPGESGLSCIEYVLQGHATVPAEMGVLLGETRRMHPAVCRFISDAVYEGRLTNIPETERYRVIRTVGTALVPAEAGIVFVPVNHDGCAQWSDEEGEVVEKIIAELLGRTVVGPGRGPRPMTLDDILLVAPFNMQVRRLRGRLRAKARVGTVDKFQGQEAPVVIVSLCASSLDEAPRGAEFLLSPNRINVAVSRAQALAIVVGSPELLESRPTSIDEMKLVNLLCRLEQYAHEAMASK